MSQAASRRHQDGPKTPTRCLKTSRSRPQDASKAPADGPTTPRGASQRPRKRPKTRQDAPRRPQDSSISSQDTPKTPQGASKTSRKCPKTLQDFPRTHPRHPQDGFRLASPLVPQPDPSKHFTLCTLLKFFVRSGSISTLPGAPPWLHGASRIRLCRVGISANGFLCGLGACKGCQTNHWISTSS